MAGPLDLEIVAPVESEFDILTFQFVDDRAVVDTPDRGALSITLVVEPRAFLSYLHDVDSADAEHFLGEQEIGQSLLVGGIDLHEDDVFRIVRTEDGAMEELAVRVGLKAAEKVFQLSP